ncbi:MAG: hypothetical protein ACE5KU_00290 [Nitrososphaerales archaeon]
MVSDTMKDDAVRRYFLKVVNGELPDLQKKVLSKLAEIGPLSIYELRKKLGIRGSYYSSIHQAVKALENMELVECIQIKKNVKNVDSKIYGLTETGVLVLLILRPKDFDLKKCLSFYESPYPPPVIKFLDALGEDYALAFREAFTEYFELLPSMEKWGRKRKNEFFLGLLIPRITAMNIDKGKIIQCISGDKQLKKMFMVTIDEFKNQLDLFKTKLH